MKGSSKEMLLRMFEEEGGVAVVKNNSNDEQTPYIPPKKPSTLLLNGTQTTNKNITTQPFHQRNSHTLINSNKGITIISPYLALPINHCPSKYPCTSNTTIWQNNNQLEFMREPLTLSLHKNSSQLLRSFSEIKTINLSMNQMRNNESYEWSTCLMRKSYE